MATVATFEAPGGTVNVVVSDEEGPGGSKDLAEVGRTVASVVAALAAELNRLGEESAPGEVTVSFGVVALARGACAISLNEEEANFRVRLKWSGGDAPEDLG